MRKQNPPLDEVTQQQVLDAHAAGENGKVIAHLFDLSETVVSRVIRRGAVYVRPLVPVPVRLVRAYKCPGCNRAVMFEPCVICRTLRVQRMERGSSGE